MLDRADLHGHHDVSRVARHVDPLDDRGTLSYRIALVRSHIPESSVWNHRFLTESRVACASPRYSSNMTDGSFGRIAISPGTPGKHSTAARTRSCW